MSAAPTPCALAAKLTLIAVLRKEGAQSQLQRPLYSIGGQGVQIRSAGEVFAVRIVGATRLRVDGCPSFQRRCGFGTPDRWGRSVQGLSLPSRQLEDRTTSIGEGGYHAGKWFPRVGFIVTNLETPSRAVMRFYMRSISQCRRKAGWVYEQCRF
jgi:hypothetical protein